LPAAFTPKSTVDPAEQRPGAER